MLKVAGIGDIKIKPHPNKPDIITLHDVYHIPTLGTNLFSLPRVTMKSKDTT